MTVKFYIIIILLLLLLLLLLYYCYYYIIIIITVIFNKHLQQFDTNVCQFKSYFCTYRPSKLDYSTYWYPCCVIGLELLIIFQNI